MTSNKREAPARRRAHILTAALKVAERDGFADMKQAAIAEEAKVSYGLVAHYLGDMDAVRDAVMQAAVDREALRVVAYGIITDHPTALSAPKRLKMRALRNVGC